MALFAFLTPAGREGRATPTAGDADDPDVDAERLRLAMGQFATGVTIITTRDRSGQAFGTTANAVTSVSLAPAARSGLPATGVRDAGGTAATSPLCHQRAA